MRSSRAARFGLAVLACVFAASVAKAQSIRGVVVDRADHPVAGVVLQLVDSASKVTARALSNERGEFRIAAPRAGTYRVSSMRIGFKPSVSQPYRLGAGETRSERLSLLGIEIALDTMKVTATSSCRVKADSGAQTFAVLEQARTALLAAELTRAARNIASTTVLHERTLDAGGRRTLKQNSLLRTEFVQQPWRSIPPDTLHRTGFVVRDDDNATNYFAPGIDMLISDVFLADHCFHLVSEKDRVGVAFEPTIERRQTTEIAGTMWLDRTSAALRSVEFHYVNLPESLEANSGGDLEFAQLTTGAWAVSRWNIRMPVIQKRTRSSAFGGSDYHVVEVQIQGGELVLALHNKDTVFSQPPRVLSGIVRDSASGRALPGARVAILGTTIASTADDKGKFALSGVLPGVYVLHVKTASLDSVGAVHQMDVEFTNEETLADVRVPSASALMNGLCGEQRQPQPGVIIGQVAMRGNAPLPRDTKVLVDWRTPEIRRAGGATSITSTHDYREVRTTPDGTFRVCNIPVESDLSIHANSDSGYAELFFERLAAGARVARVELSMTRTDGAIALFAGRVLTDSTRVPLPGVNVTLTDLGWTAQTDDRGAFRISAIPVGEHRVSIRKIGYGALDTTMTFGGGQTIQRDVFLERITQLAEVNTTASKLPRSFEENRQMQLGSFKTLEELKKLDGATTPGVLSQLRGARIFSGAGTLTFLSSNRRHDCIPGLPCPADYFDLHCYAQIYIDDHLMNPGAPTPPYDIRSTLAISEMEALEFYAGASEVPAKYSGHNVNCGVLVMWTRRSA